MEKSTDFADREAEEKMRFFRTDFSRKYVIAEIDGKEVTVSFYDTFRKGVHDVEIFTGQWEVPVKVKSTYPGFTRRIREVVLLLQLELDDAVNRISKRNR